MNTQATTSEATESAVQAMAADGALAGYRYLHFATHGKGNRVTAFESKLVLSQDQPTEEIKAGEPWINNEISARSYLIKSPFGRKNYLPDSLVTIEIKGITKA